MADSTGFAASSSPIAVQAVGICPLLAVDLAAETSPTGEATASGPSAVAAGRCTATSPAPAISPGQRRLVCEDAGHLDCPRYVRATKSGRGPVGGRGGRAPVVPVVAVAAIAAEPAGSARIAGPGRPPVSDADDAGSRLPAVHAEPAVGDAPAESGEVGAGVESGEVGAGIAAEAGPEAATVARTAQGATAAPTAAPTAVRGPDPAPVPVRPLTRASGRSGARRAGPRPIPILIAGSILVVCLVIAFVFTSLRGGLALPGATPGGGASAGVGLTSPGTLAPSSAIPSGSSVAPTPTAVVTPTPTPTPTATPSPSPKPTASLPAAYAGLKPCPGRTGCYLYRIRSGDSLTKVADRFGITLVALKAANPEIKSPSLLHVGDVVRVPLPKH